MGVFWGGVDGWDGWMDGWERERCQQRIGEARERESEEKMGSRWTIAMVER